MSLPPLLYVVPVHNDEDVLLRAVAKLTRELSRRSPREGRHAVLLVENGSRDRSWALCQEIEGNRDGVTVRAFQEPSAGLGFALDRGIRESATIDVGTSEEPWLVLTASDLPFGFSDLDAFERRTRPDTPIAVGSKAHPASDVPTAASRALMTAVYRVARRLLVGMRTGDSQGTFLLRRDIALRLEPQIRSRDYFFTTELVFLAERAGIGIEELPVIQVPEVRFRRSTVRPLRDGTRMFRSLLALRHRR